jgi:hypothetical protein
MHPSSAAVAAIRAKVADWIPDDATIAAGLNARDADNPRPAAMIPAPITFAGVFVLLAGGLSLGRIRDLSTGADLIAKVHAGDRAGIANWLPALRADPEVITAEQAQAVMALLQSTVADPSWPPLLSWAEIHIGRSLDPSDISEARPS